MKIGDVLINWYIKHKRPLPWRKLNNPYHIWVSEIIMQQTRIAQGIDYYLKFIKTFPDIYSLANAPIDEVLKVWQGLGYYSRARNMHIAAAQIVKDNNGLFPGTAQELQKLKGIGTYTSAAIASICFNEKVPVVDGNVIRFISRLNGFDLPVSSAKLQQMVTNSAFEYMSDQIPGEINQAMMEFGALQCIPGKPDCSNCPFIKKCFAFTHDKINVLPVKPDSKKIKIRYFNYLVVIHDSKIMLKKRMESDIWQGLYDFPLIETSKRQSLSAILMNDEFVKLFGAKKVSVLKSKPVKHILSHQIIDAQFFEITVKGSSPTLVQNAKYVEVKSLKKYPVAKIIEKYIAKELKK